MTITWNNQGLVFNYYFPTYGNVFTGSPVDFVANGTPYLSTLPSLFPATFSISNVTPYEEQISYAYPQATSSFTLTSASFNGFTISGPAGDSPIVAVLVDSGNSVPSLTSSELSFTNDSVTVNLAGDVFSTGSVGLIDVDFAVPEPTSVALLASALLAVFAITRLRRSYP
jgi:hypothetical protein